MDALTPNFQTKTLQRSDDPGKYALYKAALEWDLVDPIVIESRDDLKSEYRWRDRLEPYHHQVTNLITFCRRLPVTLLADDVGLGKTISAGLVMSELIARGRLSKILIVCPKILREQWQEELKLKFGIPAVIATGRELITAKPPGDTGAVITTYQSARLYLDQIEKSGFDMLILDEAHKLRNLYGVDPTPQVAQRFRKALADRLFKYVLMLTATPIQNRLWDLYSLVDLLTVARGHQNPFGSEGMFARKFIADSRTQARKLNPETSDEFRSIVYGYMSRVRRGDANLHFPERQVQLHRVDPTPKEVELINTIAEPIQDLNYLAQIVILQALISSPEALTKVLNGMANKGTAPASLAASVREVTKHIPLTAKLRGLSALINKLKEEQPEKWRVVVFTRWRETQTSIQLFLEEQGIACGLINGDSAIRNQETISRFKKDSPDINVIVSTEAGSEGVNLQVANVLVNYDLPWNPMIVEQRIGRIQRLSSNHANVSIFNIVLNGTFEEYIVGRLMEKLQMASHAIGDVESLLEASGIDEDEENGTSSFEEKIRQLVVASLAGKNIEEATRKAEKSISEAKVKLEHEEKNINALLGGMDGMENGPRCPKLPGPTRSMEAQDFVLLSLKSLGARLSPQGHGMYLSEIDGQRELVRFEEGKAEEATASILYAPGSPAFEKLVSKISADRWHCVEDTDHNTGQKIQEVAHNWTNEFESQFVSAHPQNVRRYFNGEALVRVRATVAHDSYERLIEVPCSPEEHFNDTDSQGIDPVGDFIENPELVGAVTSLLSGKSMADSGIAEFCRFYTERLKHEIGSAGDDNRKQKKLEDDFTPRVEINLVGLRGKVHRQVKSKVTYDLGDDKEYTSTLTIIPSTGEIIDSPEMAKCAQTGKIVPSECLGKCAITGLAVLRHLLIKSEVSDRIALSEHMVVCALTGKHVLIDEVEESSVTGRLVAKLLLKTSAISGRRAEADLFVQCGFSSSEILESESAVSDVSGKRYRIDEKLQSVVSGHSGHRREFIVSSLSGAPLLEKEAIRSTTGKFCIPVEAKTCFWSGRRCHPDDLRVCSLTKVPLHIEFTIGQGKSQLEPLLNLLNGISKKSDRTDLWDSIATNAATVLGGRCKVNAAKLSPDKQQLAISLEIRTWAGLKVRQAGLLYSIPENSFVGHATIGKSGKNGWVESK